MGLTVVVLGVNFLSVIFEPQETNLAVYGIGYALPIAALAYFMKVRSHISKGSSEEERTEIHRRSDLCGQRIKVVIKRKERLKSD